MKAFFETLADEGKILIMVISLCTLIISILNRQCLWKVHYFDIKYFDYKCKKSVCSGLAKTNNYEEIPADSLDEIYKLIYHVFGALKHRADPKLMNEHLQHIPSTYHRKLNYLAQYGAQVFN